MDEITVSRLTIDIGASSDDAKRKIDGVAKSLSKLRGTTNQKIKVDAKDVDKAHKKVGALTNILNSLKRIAFYRVIRSAIKAVGDAMREGEEDAYWYAKSVGDSTKYIADAYNGLTSKGFTMQNQLGAAWATLKATITPILIQIINLVTAAANAITQLFALLGGKGTYLKAIDYTKEWADQTARGGGAAKEWKNQLMGFDEINRLEEPSSGGGGGGSALPDYENMFEESKLSSWAQKLKELFGNLKINFKDVFFNWDDLNPESIAKKLIVGLGGALGAIVGFSIGGVPGAIIGTLAGVAISLLFNSVVFDNDGKLSGNEIADMLRLALFGLVGGIIGFGIGGPGGALIGVAVGAGVYAALKEVDFFADGKASNFINQLATALTIFAGAAIGFFVGGPAGALLGAAIGVGIAATIADIQFNVADNPERAKYKSGLDWFIVGILGLPSDEQWKQWGHNVADWVWEGFKDFGRELYFIFVKPFADVVADVKEMLGINSPSRVFNDIGANMVQGLWNGITEKWDRFVGFFEGLWNHLKSWWDSLSLGAFHIPRPVFSWSYTQASGIIAEALKFVGLPATIPHLNISWYAKGGIVDGATLIGAGEAGKEAIIPLERNTEWISKVAAEMNAQQARQASGNNSNDIGAALEDANDGVINAIFAVGAQVVQAIAESGSSGDIDWRQVSQQVTKYQRQMARANG